MLQGPFVRERWEAPVSTDPKWPGQSHTIQGHGASCRQVVEAVAASLTSTELLATS